MEMENKSRLQISLTERLADILTLRLNLKLHKEGLELQKMKLGIEIILINLSKFIVIFSVATYFHLFKETALMLLVFASIKRNAFGLHAKNSMVCTLTSLLLFVAVPYLSYNLRFNNYIVLASFSIIILLLYKYAPGDTESHPLLGEKLRKRLKRESMITGTVLMLIALIIPSEVVKTMITVAVSCEIISILPITYKILNRGYKNYEKYERGII